MIIRKEHGGLTSLYFKSFQGDYYLDITRAEILKVNSNYIMSVIIDIDNYPSLSSVLLELEKQGVQNKGPFCTTKPAETTTDHQLRKPRSFTTIAREPPQEVKTLRRGSDPSAERPKKIEPRLRVQSAPCPSVDPALLQGDSRLTENAKKLSDEELALLYEGILKPLDFNSILFERMQLGERI